MLHVYDSAYKIMDTDTYAQSNTSNLRTRTVLDFGSGCGRKLTIFTNLAPAKM